MRELCPRCGKEFERVWVLFRYVLVCFDCMEYLIKKYTGTK